MNTVEENASGVGGWGGTCQCPDGTQYEVGDNHDSCGTLACINGEKINCHESVGEWSNRKVTCKGTLWCPGLSWFLNWRENKLLLTYYILY